MKPECYTCMCLLHDHCFYAICVKYSVLFQNSRSVHSEAVDVCLTVPRTWSDMLLGYTQKAVITWKVTWRDPKVMVNPGYHKTILLATQDYVPAVKQLDVVAKQSPTKRNI